MRKVTNKRCPETTLSNLIPYLWEAFDLTGKLFGFLPYYTIKDAEKEMWNKWLGK